MNISLKPGKSTLLAAAITVALVTACSTPTRPDGADAARARLTQLQSNPSLATQAPLAMKEADLAVTAAETPQKDQALGAHLVVVADRKIEIARAQAESHLAIDQRKALGEQREAMRLQSRTQEADSANLRANIAVADASAQKHDADQARSDTADAQRKERDLQAQIEAMQAKVTERGIVLTLGDVLFTTNTADLSPDANNHLSKLAAFLNKYPERKTEIEGHTDSMGTDSYNQGLSQRRADAVKSYLMQQGISGTRLTSTGKGEGSPVGDNASAAGRQQNRRVEVIIENQLVSAL